MIKTLQLVLILTLSPLCFACGSNAGSGVEGDPFFVTAPSGLRMRSEPNTTSARLRLIPHAAQVHVLKYSDEKDTIEGKEAPWAQVSYEGVSGWVFSGFLAKEKP